MGELQEDRSKGRSCGFQTSSPVQGHAIRPVWLKAAAQKQYIVPGTGGEAETIEMISTIGSRGARIKSKLVSSVCGGVQIGRAASCTGLVMKMPASGTKAVLKLCLYLTDSLR